ncbi:MAG: hypothetical protein Q7R47_01330, partial [Candidatus Diapherotrites archaeon]|nr:hypothetical protein [Candidatus Diapherotrites archaeon]
LAFRAESREYFVATNGNDGWSGKSASANPAKNEGPWASFQKAVETAKQAGFGEARIAKPEYSPYFRQKPGETKAGATARQQRMKKLYYEVANAERFEEADTYFFKKLSL